MFRLNSPRGFRGVVDLALVQLIGTCVLAAGTVAMASVAWIDSNRSKAEMEEVRTEIRQLRNELRNQQPKPAADKPGVLSSLPPEEAARQIISQASDVKPGALDVRGQRDLNSGGAVQLENRVKAEADKAKGADVDKK